MILERDMYGPIEKYLNQKKYMVYGEVKSIDIIGLKKKDLIIIEMKKSLNLKVLTQAVSRKKYTHRVYIAILQPMKITEHIKKVEKILERLGIGLLYVNILESVSQVYERLKPIESDKDSDYIHEEYLKLMKELDGRSGSYNKGGIVKEKIITAYREQAIYIGCCLEKYGPLSSKVLKSLGVSDKAYSIMYSNHYGWFEKTGRGIFSITNSGMEGIEKYPRVREYYNKKLDKVQLTKESL